MEAYRLPRKVSRRVGNWCEEKLLREEKLKEFLARVESGDVGFLRREKRIRMATEPRELSSNLHFGSYVMLKSEYTNGFVSTIPSDLYPSLNEAEKLQVTTSSSQDPRQSCARSVLILERAFEDNDPRVRYGQKMYITLQLPGVDRPLYMTSVPPTTYNFPEWGTTKYQSVYFTFEKSPKSLWKFEFADEEYRLEMEFKPIDPSHVGILTHVSTGKQLTASDDPKFLLSSDFGVESGVLCSAVHSMVLADRPKSWFKFVIKS